MSEEVLKERLGKSIVRYNRLKLKNKYKKNKAFKLIEKMPKMAKQMGFKVTELSVSFKVSGSIEDRAVYISKISPRLDILGFSLENNNLFTPVEKEVSKRKHMGRISAQLFMNEKTDESILQAYKSALERLDPNENY